MNSFTGSFWKEALRWQTKHRSRYWMNRDAAHRQSLTCGFFVVGKTVNRRSSFINMRKQELGITQWNSLMGSKVIWCVTVTAGTIKSRMQNGLPVGHMSEDIWHVPNRQTAWLCPASCAGCILYQSALPSGRCDWYKILPSMLSKRHVLRKSSR